MTFNTSVTFAWRQAGAFALTKAMSSQLHRYLKFRNQSAKAPRQRANQAADSASQLELKINSIREAF